jgi:V/A-type H+-transporting ATPase subunit K
MNFSQSSSRVTAFAISRWKSKNELTTQEYPMTKRLFISSLVAKAMMLAMSVALFWFGATMVTMRAQAAAEAPVAAPVETPASALGMKYLSAALAVGIGSVAAGIAVAMVGSAAMGAVAERPELMGRSLIYVGLAEGIAIYGVVVAIMILMG